MEKECVFPDGQEGVTCGCLWVVVVCAFETLSRGCLNPGRCGWWIFFPRTAVGGRYTIQSIWFHERKVDQDDLSSSVEAGKESQKTICVRLLASAMEG